MRKILAAAMAVLFLLPNLVGCTAVGSKSGNLSVVYGAAAALSFLLLVGCVFLVRKKRVWFFTLFSSVFVVNLGYTLLATSSCLEMALWANRIAYLGSVFLPPAMLMIVLNMTRVSYKRYLPLPLICLSLLMFFVTAKPPRARS